MATNTDEYIASLRPSYDFPLSSLAKNLGSRGLVYRAICSGSRVLDVDCDTGRFGETLQLEKGCIVDGIESWIPAPEVARTRLNQVFSRTVEDERSFEGLAEYDTLLFLDVLEHLQNPWAVLVGALKTLRPGGTVQIVVPNIAHISVIRRLLQGQFEYGDYGTMDRTHLRWFTRKSLKKYLEEAGFVNVKIESVYSLPYFHSNSFLSKFLIQQLGKVFPDLLSSSIIARGQRAASYKLDPVSHQGTE